MKENRKKYLISPSFQLRFIGHFMLVVLITCSVIYTAYTYFFHHMKEAGVTQGLPSDHIYFLLLRDQQIFMNSIFAAVFIFLFFFFSIYAILFSHRIAGPIFKLKNYFISINDQNTQELPPLHFRKNDYFQEIVEPINEYLFKKRR